VFGSAVGSGGLLALCWGLLLFLIIAPISLKKILDLDGLKRMRIGASYARQMKPYAQSGALSTDGKSSRLKTFVGSAGRYNWYAPLHHPEDKSFNSDDSFRRQLTPEQMSALVALKD
jgi:hypothetical protein